MRKPPVIIFIILGCFLLFLVYSSRQNLQSDLYVLSQSINISLANVVYKANPPRHFPLDLISRQDRLKAELGQPFVFFSNKDWKVFWNLIYSTYVLEPNTDNRLPGKCRQLTLEEIQQRLIGMNSTFSYYGIQNWNYIWNKIIRVSR